MDIRATGRLSLFGVPSLRLAGTGAIESSGEYRFSGTAAGYVPPLTYAFGRFSLSSQEGFSGSAHVFGLTYLPGVDAPRDTDMQAAELGKAISIPKDLEGLRRGDLVFWQGHVGIMSDGIMLVHANAHHMAVAAETLPEAADRIAKQGSPITIIRRLESRAGATS